MIAPGAKQISSTGERGYALLMVIFMVATLVIFGIMADLSINTEGRRQKEDELAWRGNQYRRAIGLFLKKNGRYPKTMDELTAHHTDQPNFIRKAYKDPMNAADGSWRLIYVLPNGQLRGSFMHQQLQGVLPIAGPLGGTPGGTNPTTSFAGATGQQPASGTGTGTGTQQPPSTTQPGTPGQSDQSTNASPVFGGSIVGVASKISKDSIRVYKLGTKYDHWEFIYDQSAVAGGPVSGTPTTLPTGTQSPANPGQTQNPGQPQGPGQSQGPGQ